MKDNGAMALTLHTCRTVMASSGADSRTGILPDGRRGFGKKPFLDKLIGNSWVREMIMEGNDAQSIKARWRPDVEAFKVRRRPYLLYEE